MVKTTQLEKQNQGKKANAGNRGSVVLIIFEKKTQPFSPSWNSKDVFVLSNPVVDLSASVLSASETLNRYYPF